MTDPRSPVVVGVGQVSERPEDPGHAPEPIDLLAEAVRRAGADSGARHSLVSRADTIGVVDIVSWKYPDPGALLARRLAVEPRTTVTTTIGGNSPQLLLSEVAASIQRGDTDVAVIGGAECVYTRWRARREPKTWLDWTEADDPPCGRVLGDPRPGSNDYEMAHFAAAPTQIYPLFETAVRAAAGRSLDEHQVRVSELWSQFAAVAAENPFAWSRTPYRPEEIRTVTPDNRMVTVPYTKRMCANIDVDQAAALIVCSYGAARDAGVPDERMVFPLAGADAHDTYWISERVSLCESPAIGAAGRAALAACGLGLDDVARFDLYSCFPSAVQIARDALGIDDADPRPLTVTGGLAFAGGPANNYPMHAIAAMVEACRRDPGSYGFVSALGWYVTKHSVAVYSTRPPANGFARVDPAPLQAELDALPRRHAAGAYEGDATVEATAVVVERDGTPSLAIVSTLTPDDRRALCNTRDADVLASMASEAWEGRAVKLRTDGKVNELIAGYRVAPHSSQ